MLELNSLYNSFYIKNEKLSKKYIIFIIICLIIIISIISLFLIIKYNKNITISGIVTNNKINLYLSDKDLNSLLQSNYVVINKKHYKITSINVLEPLIEQNVIYYQIELEINSIRLINNVILSLEIPSKKESIFNEIIRIMKGV